MFSLPPSALGGLYSKKVLGGACSVSAIVACAIGYCFAKSPVRATLRTFPQDGTVFCMEHEGLYVSDSTKRQKINEVFAVFEKALPSKEPKTNLGVTYTDADCCAVVCFSWGDVKMIEFRLCDRDGAACRSLLDLALWVEANPEKQSTGATQEGDTVLLYRAASKKTTKITMTLHREYRALINAQRVLYLL